MSSDENRPTDTPDGRAQPPSSGVLIGRSLLGPNRGRSVLLDIGSVAKHTLAVGASGTGKTTVIKAMAESLLAKGASLGIQGVVALDVMGDLSGLAVPAPTPGAYTALGLPAPVDLTSDDWSMAHNVTRHLAGRVHARYLTPLSDKGERLAINPLPQRPRDFDEMWAQERDEIEKMASTAAWTLMGRVGMKQPRDGEGGRAELIRGILSDTIIAAWQNRENLEGVDGLMQFEALVAQGGNLGDRERKALSDGLKSLSKSVSARWLEGRRLDWDNLLQAPSGKTPFVSIDLQYVPAEHVGWAVAQSLNSLFDWASGQPRQPGRPRVLVLIDELAGEGGKMALLPPLNYKSASGTAIRRTLRKGRHVGVALAAATQGPSDCDFKTFSLFNTRLIGRLNDSRNANAALSGIESNDEARKMLIQQIAKAGVGQMICIRPKYDPESIQVRWLGTLHSRIPAEHLPRLYREGVLNRPNDGEEERTDSLADPSGLCTQDRRRLIYIDPTWVGETLIGVTAAVFKPNYQLDARGRDEADVLRTVGSWAACHGARSGLRLVCSDPAVIDRLRAVCDRVQVQLPGLDQPIFRVALTSAPEDRDARRQAVEEYLLVRGYHPLEITRAASTPKAATQPTAEPDAAGTQQDKAQAA